jgi:pyruvate,water dikinase
MDATPRVQSARGPQGVGARLVEDLGEKRAAALVAPTTDPGWTPLFLTAGGLVTETGSPMARGLTVAREYDIPAVICVRDATQLISTGQLITVDGASGTVILAAAPAA